MIQTRELIKKQKRFLKVRTKIIKQNKNLKIFIKVIFLIKKKIPLIDAKIAISKDFFTINKNSKWITNYRSRRVAHLIRSKYNCIVSTSETINKDNALLNCRIEGLEKGGPDLIIIDRKLKLKKILDYLTHQKKENIYFHHQ